MSRSRPEADRDLEDLALEVCGIAAVLMALGEPRVNPPSEGIAWLGGQLERVSKGIDALVEADIRAGRSRP